MRLKIIPNPKKPWAKELAQELTAVIAPAHKVVRKNADATICIGGDGTILYANYRNRIEGPVLGIGGAKSYICQLRKDNWRGSILEILRSNHTIQIMTLDAELAGKQYTALNDFVVHTTSYRVIELAVSVDTAHCAFEGDGMIASTPMGSAAYAYSAGGPKLTPTEGKLILVPICPYKRAFQPKVLEPETVVTIGVGNDCAFIVDGIFVRKLAKGEQVNIRKGKPIIFFNGVGNNDWHSKQG